MMVKVPHVINDLRNLSFSASKIYSIQQVAKNVQLEGGIEFTTSHNSWLFELLHSLTLEMEFPFLMLSMSALSKIMYCVSVSLYE